MAGLLLVPYNDSMRLGQGFNSFLQMPCVYNAVKVNPESSKFAKKDVKDGVAQVVSYSSRFVDKISDVTRSMNISAGSSIKNGSVTMSGNSLSVDESKFSASDLNAVVSIKVINQTTVLDDNAQFSHGKDLKLKVDTNEEFFDVYGDCYVSGFIQGGDLHGIVSIKVLDAAHKESVKEKIKGQFNVGAQSGSEFHLGNSSSSSTGSSYGAELWQSETTISVSWSGGGQIKQPDEEWSIDLLFQVAAAFPAKVAACPQRTWAILTRYDNNLSFLQWADTRKIKSRDFTDVQLYASDLLDTYMEYKNNLLTIQNVLSRPGAYKVGPGNRPVNLAVADLVAERKKMKKEMRKIIRQIDKLNLNPAILAEIEDNPEHEIESPEIWATRLPVLISETTDQDLTKAAVTYATNEALDGFLFVHPPPAAAHAPPPAPIPPISAPVVAPRSSSEAMAPTVLPDLAPADVKAVLTPEEQAFVSSLENRTRYANYRFARPGGNLTRVLTYNDLPTLEGSLTPAGWPTQFQVKFVSWESDPIVGNAVTKYETMVLSHGSERGHVMSELDIALAPGEVINRVKIGTSREGWGVTGVVYFEVWTSAGQNKSAGSVGAAVSIVECQPPAGFVGLKGLFGSDGDVVDRIGVIWGV
ncbi:hypothetical protein B0H16DRAFT_729585 [Mycena metata]|uniref:Jacalin-type lectin domain-containing protein n=1 Tax=Mycena metata TaxID=1033252 RepID=A0AAD7K7L3_9AGAR|nr:hypothetical protein B0H16DRAFT_729585 [Mycena metata]